MIGLRVLVVDDNHLVAATVAEMLAGAGSIVTIATDGVAALRLADRWFYDVLVTDLEMPNMDGWALVAALRRARPWLPVVVVSGALPADPEDADLLRGRTRLLGKPFGAPQLLSAVAHVSCALAMRGASGCDLALSAPGADGDGLG